VLLAAMSPSNDSGGASKSAKRTQAGKAQKKGASEAALHERLTEAVAQNRGQPRMADRFAVVTRGLLTDRVDPCWAVLEPRSGVLQLWHHPPEQDCCNMGAEELRCFSKSSTSLGCFIGPASTTPPTVPFKSLNLETLRNIDCNPNFLSIFLGFKGAATWCLTAQNRETFRKWLYALDCYDVFSNPASKM